MAVIAGDGSALVSKANGNGKRSCECRAEGKRDCECRRYYSDPTADWGYDSYRECYYFGHTFYQHVISTEGHDLPVHLTIGSASETDFTLSLKSLSRLGKALAENGVAANISHAIYDAGHDANGIYDYLANKQISPIIALNSRNVSETETGRVVVNERGVPICEAGLEMRRHSFAKKKRRIAFNCPLTATTKCHQPLKALTLARNGWIESWIGSHRDGHNRSAFGFGLTKHSQWTLVNMRLPNGFPLFMGRAFDRTVEGNPPLFLGE